VFWPLIARTPRLLRSVLPGTALSARKADQAAPRVAAMTASTTTSASPIEPGRATTGNLDAGLPHELLVDQE
jgi:hypothetical protein